MSKHVLLIEDEPNISEAIRFILSRDGFRVSCHAQGAGAIQAVLDLAPDILILDAMLPGRNGYDILRELRQQKQTAELPILMLTARGQGRDREMAAAAGASGFMAKPFANSEILALVRSLLAPV